MSSCFFVSFFLLLPPFALFACLAELPFLEEALLAEEVLLEDAFLPFATCFAACVPALFFSAIASPSMLFCVIPS